MASKTAFNGSREFEGSHGGKLGVIASHGRESSAKSTRLAFMHLAIRDIGVNTSVKARDTHFDKLQLSPIQ